MDSSRPLKVCCGICTKMLAADPLSPNLLAHTPKEESRKERLQKGSKQLKPTRRDGHPGERNSAERYKPLYEGSTTTHPGIYSASDKSAEEAVR
ncbi:hypothetical protein DPX16_0657 [Anabarilius grahami]|uniref:Uncharacterized protein n=1 Tax=Anabarilius grahami TaxID=495550 RepID=A0A3N0YFB9_ANAGA|nr:hypothetical protein DPX16_0657 [Anabarilius grahami]